MDNTRFKKSFYFRDDSSFCEGRDNKSQYYRSKEGKEKDGRSFPGKIRVPSLKRSKSTWNKFYKLFPELKGQSHYLGGNNTFSKQNESFIPLKQI